MVEGLLVGLGAVEVEAWVVWAVVAVVLLVVDEVFSPQPAAPITSRHIIARAITVYLAIDLSSSFSAYGTLSSIRYALFSGRHLEMHAVTPFLPSILQWTDQFT